MGSPNFGFSDWVRGVKFGYVPEYPSDEDAKQAMADYEWDDDDLTVVKDRLYEDNNMVSSDLYDDVFAELSDRVNTVVNKLWRLGDIVPNIGYLEFPYELRFEHGYHDGWVCFIEGNQAERKNDDNDYQAYLALYGLARFPPKDGEIETTIRSVCEQFDADYVSYEDFCQHVNEVLDAVMWVYQNYCMSLRLQGIAGGWTGGSYKVEPSDLWEIDHPEKWAEMFPEFVYNAV